METELHGEAGESFGYGHRRGFITLKTCNLHLAEQKLRGRPVAGWEMGKPHRLHSVGR